MSSEAAHWLGLSVPDFPLQMDTTVCVTGSAVIASDFGNVGQPCLVALDEDTRWAKNAQAGQC